LFSKTGRALFTLIPCTENFSYFIVPAKKLSWIYKGQSLEQVIDLFLKVVFHRIDCFMNKISIESLTTNNREGNAQRDGSSERSLLKARGFKELSAGRGSKVATFMKNVKIEMPEKNLMEEGRLSE
jgi:hypothetical protein